MKKINKFLLIPLLFCLSSCNQGLSVESSTNTLSSNSQVSSSNEESSTISSSDTFNSSSSEESSSEPPKFEETEYDQYLKQSCYGRLPARGQSKMLVVPVVFNDFSSYVSTSIRKEITSNLEATFFGNTEDTGWESVSSYYYKSSYGKLDIQGEVAPCYDTSKSITSYISTSNASDITVTSDEILQEVYNAYFQGENKIYETSDYDSDHDGIIDAIYLIYYYPYRSCPTSQYPSYLKTSASDNQGLFWAFTYWWFQDDNTPLGSYSWSSYFFIKDGGYSKPDAHTYIHETGHLLGLADYYDTSSTGSVASPCGGLTMQDSNILDQDSNSKYLLNWSNPTILDNTSSTQTLTIRPFEKTGDSIIIKNESHDTVFEEYLIVEYYTPTGLNELDSQENYSDHNYKGFTQEGIKIYHADNRLGKIEQKNNGWYWDKQFYYHPDFSSYDENSFYEIATSNSSERNYSGLNQLRLLEATGSDRLITQYPYTSSSHSIANNNSLFKEGNSLLQSYPDYSFHTGDKIPCDISVTSLSSIEAKITITF